MVSLDRFLAIYILIQTVFIAIYKPKIGSFQLNSMHAVFIGLGVFIATGIVPIALAVSSLKLLIVPLITIVGLMIIKISLEEIKLFDWLSHKIAIAANGDGRKLFFNTFFVSAVVGAFFSNDAAVLIFTPLIYALIEKIQGNDWSLKNKIPFYFSVLFVTNVVGVFVISNPINIVVSQLFGISFLEYAKWMALPGLASIIISYLGLLFIFRKDIPKNFTAPSEKDAVIFNRKMKVAVLILLVTLISFFFEPLTGLTAWLVVLISASVFILFRRQFTENSCKVLFFGINWSILIFVAGMFIIAIGVRNVGLTQVLANFIQQISSGSEPLLLMLTSYCTAFLSAIMNNHPAADTMIMTIRDMGVRPNFEKFTAFACMIGGDLGPKMLPTGSLAALLWFKILKEKGVRVPYLQYIKIGVPVTLVAIFISVSILYFEFLLFYI